MWHGSCIVIGMKLVICFILALTKLAANVGTPFYGIRGYPAPEPKEAVETAKRITSGKDTSAAIRPDSGRAENVGPAAPNLRRIKGSNFASLRLKVWG
jgi:hypothetical protein